MSSIEKRLRDGNTTWVARWRDPSRKQRKRSFSRKLDAQRFLATVEADLVRGSYVDPNDKTVFRDYAESWRLAQVHRPTTQAHVETNLRRNVYPCFGDRRLASIRPSEVQAWVSRLSSEPDALSASTVQVVHGIMASIYKAAIRDRLVSSSPCEGTRLPKKLPREIVPLTTETVEALISAAPPRLRALVVLGAGTGMRQGECFGLALDRIDFLRRTLRVDQQLVLMPGKATFLAPPKTSASHRTIPLPQVVVEELAEHVRRFPSSHPDGLVFTVGNGSGLRRTAFSRVWRPMVAAAGAPVGTGFHDLRHYFASLLIRHGESVKTVQSRLGHATAAETLDTYSHLWPDSDDRTREAVDTVLRRPAVPPVCPDEESEEGAS
ncbi:tyrosine-type recombinase/integrase [Actinomycetospora rhizophila]|uniref:Tyrosine-type recombinase/integrase n=1 Tax=Actinomycetospora rhizophila TaxID=1416876 RepID=A0ABV9ZIX7_9PSEU